jgi:hypothetical protein
MCANLIALGAFGIVFTLVLGFIFLSYTYREVTRPNIVTLMTAILSSVYTFICVVAAITGSVGLAQTCSQFESVSGGSCASVFSTGFLYNGDTTTTYIMDLGVTIAAINACWVLTVAFFVYSGLEWINYKSESSKWW